LKVSVIGEMGVSSITSGLPVADDEVPVEDEELAVEPELLQAASAMARTAVPASPFRIL
jgi:hypothetical protein